MFKTKDSGERQQFDTGSKRDTNAGKPRYDLISVPALKRVAMLMARGAEKYGERNWELGQPTSRFLESAMRHMFQYAEGDTSEDHAAAACWNLMAIMHFQDSNTDGQYNDLLKNKADEIFKKELPDEIEEVSETTQIRPDVWTKRDVLSQLSIERNKLIYIVSDGWLNTLSTKLGEGVQIRQYDTYNIPSQTERADIVFLEIGLAGTDLELAALSHGNVIYFSDSD